MLDSETIHNMSTTYLSKSKDFLKGILRGRKIVDVKDINAFESEWIKNTKNTYYLIVRLLQKFGS